MYPSVFLLAIPPLLQYVFMASCFVKHRDKFTFVFIFIFCQHWLACDFTLTIIHSHFCHENAAQCGYDKRLRDGLDSVVKRNSPLLALAKN
jgi:hypothetical protein